MFKTLIVFIALYAVILFLIYLFQRQLTYFPSQSFPSPLDAGVPEMQVVKLLTDDGLELRAWYRPALNSVHPTLIYFHGNAGNIGHRGIIVKPFLNEGYGVLLVTYRGYSGNPGKPSEEGLYKDARSAIDFLKSRRVPESCIVLYGESIGGSIAIQMATEYPVGGLILQAPYTTLGDIGQYHYPFFPIKWLMKDQYNSIGKVHQIHTPTLVLIGEKDDIIPPKFSLQLYDALPSLKQIDTLPDTGHNDLFDPFFTINFIKKYVKCDSGNI